MDGCESVTGHFLNTFNFAFSTDVINCELDCKQLRLLFHFEIEREGRSVISTTFDITKIPIISIKDK